MDSWYSRTKLAARFEYTICEAYPLGQGYNVKIHTQKPPQLRTIRVIGSR
ncbi:MAG: hypothetical protein RLZZ535_3202 [Cyanobacteriota bacterium]